MHTGRIFLQSVLWRGLYYVSAFAINMLIARHFEASQSGSVYYIISIYALILLVASLSLESGITYFFSKGKIAADRLFNTTITWSVAIGLLSFFIVRFYFNHAYQGITPGLMLFSAVMFIAGNLLITYCSAFFYAANNFILPAIITIAGTLLLIILIPFNGRSVLPFINDQNYFYIYFGSYFVQGLCLALAARVKFVPSLSLKFLTPVDLRLLLRYSALAFASNIIFFLLYRIDYFFVEKYCSAAQLGNYIQVSKLVHLFFVLPTILASAVFPLTARGGNEQTIDKLLTLLSRTIFLLYFLICLVLAIAGNWFFPLLFGDSFSDMYLPFLWLIPGILSLSGIFTLTAYFAGKNRISQNISGSLLALLAIAAGDILFIPVYGIQAAAIVSSFGYMIYQVYIIAVFKKEYKIAVADFFIFRIADCKKIKNTITSLLNKNETKQ